MAPKNSETIVLCIDRDNDIGVKVRVAGPIIGWKKNVEVATSLALIDPEDTDLNAIFGAVKIARQLDCEIVTLTGDSQVGIVSDQKITEQLETILAKLKPDSVILVSDGAEDEQILPLIQSRIKISSIKTIIVRQSQELEKAYFTITNFLKEVTADPNLARLLFAIPGIVLVLLAIGGLQAISFIIGIVGIYLIIKGMGFEEQFFNKVTEFIRSLSIERVSTITYIISIITLIIGLGYGYSDLMRNPIEFDNMGSALDTLSLFVVNTLAIDIMLVAVVIAIMGKIVDDIASKKYLQIRRHFIVLAFAILIKFILTAGANFSIDEAFGLGNFILWMVLGIFIFYVWVRFTENLFVSEIKSIKEMINSFTDMEVYTSEGKHLGKVSKVLIDKAEFSGIKVGRKTVGKDAIVSTDKVVVVNI